MICFVEDNSLVFGTVVPHKKTRVYNKLTNISSEGNEFYSLLDVTTYDELKNNMEASMLHERLHDCLGRGDCYTFKKSKVDFKHHFLYDELYDKKEKTGEVRQFNIEQPVLSEFCMKGTFNSFLNGRKVSRNDNCNLFNMIGKSKKALDEIRNIIKSESKEEAAHIIISKYPEFAIFYYDLIPEVDIEKSCVFNIKALNQARNIDNDAPSMLEMVPLALDNARILRLLPKKD